MLSSLPVVTVVWEVAAVWMKMEMPGGLKVSGSLSDRW